MIDTLLEAAKRKFFESNRNFSSYIDHMRKMESLAMVEQAEDDEWRESLIRCMEALDA